MLCGSLPHLHLDLSEGGMQVGRCQDHQERRQEAETLTEPLKMPSRQCSHLHGELENVQNIAQGIEDPAVGNDRHDSCPH